RRVDAPWFHEGDGDRNVFFLELHAQRVGESLDGVFRRAVVALQRNGAVGDGAGDVDERSAAAAHQSHGGEHTVHLAPIVHVELSPHVGEGDLGRATIDRY